MSHRGRRGEARAEGGEGEPLRFTPLTGILGGAGLVLIAAGFHFLNQGSINLAPALLVLGYGVLIPLALIK